MIVIQLVLSASFVCEMINSNQNGMQNLGSDLELSKRHQAFPKELCQMSALDCIALKCDLHASDHPSQERRDIRG